LNPSRNRRDPLRGFQRYPLSNIEGYKITFTKAGKYKYICTVHDNMKGEVDVG